MSLTLDQIQSLLLQKWKLWLIMAGRGFGKTTAGATAIAELIKTNRAKNIGLVGMSLFESKTIMLEGQSGLLNRVENYKYKQTDRTVKGEGWDVMFFGGDRYNSLRGFEFDWVWIDELAKFKYGTEVLDQVFFCCRKGESRIIITTTPQDVEVIRKLQERTDVLITNGTSYDNKNLSNGFFNEMKNFENTALGEQEIHGNIVGKSYWSTKDIRYKEPEHLVFYRLGVDPAVGRGTTGIILVGKNAVDENYVLEDYSTDQDPSVWCGIILELTKKIFPLEICTEINQGGNLIDSLFKIYGINAEKIFCRASKSKDYRNSLSQTYYKLNKVFHAKKLEKLEKELFFSPKDRADALFWALFADQKPRVPFEIVYF